MHCYTGALVPPQRSQASAVITILIYLRWGSDQLKLGLRSSHLRIQSSHLIFTFFAGLHSSAFTCEKVLSNLSLHFFTQPKIMSSLSSHLRNHNLQSLQKLGQGPYCDYLKRLQTLIAVSLYQCQLLLHLHNCMLQAIYIVIYEKYDFIN